MGEINSIEQVLELEVFDESGNWITNITPEQFNYFNRGMKFKIYNNRLFIIDPGEQMAVYEYKITG